MVLIIMGVAGCGKTTIGKCIAENYGISFFDADDFHPQVNIEKMKCHIPLSDTDRIPWLTVLAKKIFEWSESDGVVLACSSLTQFHRDLLCPTSVKKTCFIYLKVPYQLAFSRLQNRSDHFFPPELLRDQYKVLEEPQNAIIVQATGKISDITLKIMERLAKIQDVER